jgi:hypothetical protein
MKSISPTFYDKLLLAQIPKKDTDELTVFAHFWDLRAKKYVCKHVDEFDPWTDDSELQPWTETNTEILKSQKNLSIVISLTLKLITIQSFYGQHDVFMYSPPKKT